MTSNEKVTLKALIKLGLDVKSGKSPMILIDSLEEFTGIRHTSNGSRVVRRDSNLFGLFNIEWVYAKGSSRLESIAFRGYKTSDDIIKGLENEYLRLQNKIDNLCNQKRETLKALEWIDENGIEDLSMDDLLAKVDKI